MTKVMDAAGEKEDPKLDAQIEGYMKQLGPDFTTAWNAAEGLDENSADGKAYNAAVDDLCGQVHLSRAAHSKIELVTRRRTSPRVTCRLRAPSRPSAP